MLVFGFLLIAGLSAFVGYRIGYEDGYKQGAAALERKILHHVVNSPEYDNRVMESFKRVMERFKKALEEVYKKTK